MNAGLSDLQICQSLICHQLEFFIRVPIASICQFSHRTWRHADRLGTPFEVLCRLLCLSQTSLRAHSIWHKQDCSRLSRQWGHQRTMEIALGWRGCTWASMGSHLEGRTWCQWPFCWKWCLGAWHRNCIYIAGRLWGPRPRARSASQSSSSSWWGRPRSRSSYRGLPPPPTAPACRSCASMLGISNFLRSGSLTRFRRDRCWADPPSYHTQPTSSYSSPRSCPSLFSRIRGGRCRIGCFFASYPPNYFTYCSQPAPGYQVQKPKVQVKRILPVMILPFNYL